MNSSTASGRLS